MKALLVMNQSKSTVDIDFDLEIPTFPIEVVPPWLRGFSIHVFSRVDNPKNVAKEMAFENAGKLPVEFSKSSREIYHDFLLDLIRIEGFVCIKNSHRYGIQIEVGRLFDLRTVARNVAATIHLHFYPDDSFEVQPEKERTAQSGNNLFIPIP